MRIRIIVNAVKITGREVEGENRSEIWSGDIQILDKSLHIAKVSFIAEDGTEHPIVDIPFSPMLGWWEWHPPVTGEKYELAVDSLGSGVVPSPNPDAQAPEET